MNKQNLISQIGNTPLLKPFQFLEILGSKINLYCKCEGFNPAGSIKDRAALAMIKNGEKLGKIKNNSVIIEATSGNTGIGLALVCAQLNYSLILTMPENMSTERRAILRAMGAELILTEASKGIQGSVDKAIELGKNLPNSYLISQFTNTANKNAHYQSTAPEIWDALSGDIDFFVSTIGSGGTISGCGKYFKEKNNNIKIIGVEPAESPLISKGKTGSHIIQGIGANFIPEILDQSVIDEVIAIKGEKALEIAQIFGKNEANLVGISSGAALAAAIIIGERIENKKKKIVVVLPDRGERYLSTKLFSNIK